MRARGKREKWIHFISHIGTVNFNFNTYNWNICITHPSALNCNSFYNVNTFIGPVNESNVSSRFSTNEDTFYIILEARDLFHGYYGILLMPYKSNF